MTVFVSGALLLALIIVLAFAWPCLRRAAPCASRGTRLLLLAACAATLLLSAGAYAMLGRYDLLGRAVRMDAPPSGDMLKTLAARLEKDPGDKAGWVMLAHSLYVLEDYDGAVAAFRHSLPQLEEDPELLAEYGMALVLSPSGLHPHPPRQILGQAVARLPDNSALRVFLARELIDAGDIRLALLHLARAREIEAADPARLRLIEQMMAEAHALLKAAAGTMETS